MVSTRLRNGLAVVAIGVGLFATLGESSTSDHNATNNAPNANAGTGASSDGEGGGESSASTPVPIGTAKTVAKGWDLKVNSANLDADAALAAVNQFNTPQPGTKFVLINVSLTNNSDKPASPLTNVKMSMLPSSGVAVDSTSCMVSAPDMLDPMAQMQPGATATGNVCFQMKPEDIATSLFLAEPQFTMDKVEDQVFFAIT
ncbi:DUF4352 domain-containing protein [Rhabdothermincola sediminis]|uniref:DUF4352 domain-containing protein n=1 Tax=Rhabdothermincola sediminis TaxID=2751370 RepID=UPI001AA06DF1|nr:DUF4352 domain-containing protein [Rhabdothermincola sediminis]